MCLLSQKRQQLKLLHCVILPPSLHRGLIERGHNLFCYTIYIFIFPVAAVAAAFLRNVGIQVLVLVRQPGTDRAEFMDPDSTVTLTLIMSMFIHTMAQCALISQL